MDLEFHDFRNAKRLLGRKRVWTELKGALGGISEAEICAAYERLSRERQAVGKKSYAGGQTAINGLVRSRLDQVPGWLSEPKLFNDPGRSLRGWKMDFIKGGVGVEISFNHAEAIPWTFTRLDIAGESSQVVPAHRIDVGVAVFPLRAFKSWAKMDSAVGTFERAIDWLEVMRPVIARPILVVGLGGEGWKAGPFRGTAKGTRTRP